MYVFLKKDDNHFHEKVKMKQKILSCSTYFISVSIKSLFQSFYLFAVKVILFYCSNLHLENYRLLPPSIVLDEQASV